MKKRILLIVALLSPLFITGALFAPGLGVHTHSSSTQGGTTLSGVTSISYSGSCITNYTFNTKTGWCEYSAFGGGANLGSGGCLDVDAWKTTTLGLSSSAVIDVRLVPRVASTGVAGALRTCNMTYWSGTTCSGAGGSGELVASAYEHTAVTAGSQIGSSHSTVVLAQAVHGLSCSTGCTSCGYKAWRYID